ncbi:AAA family ATPase [Rhodococcus sp. P1Y]|uniref:AAA family ATPase n=1 Tax=Rhodococcus sp. P1Y TaxID=1302308 RepID=UPI00137A1683|nr:AAA family ATPase [Rhodococcus sp. P1Y]
MTRSCQGAPENDREVRPVLIVAGAAGSGKTTLGKQLAQIFSVALLDLDSLTNPLLDRLDPLIDGPHWNSAGPHSEAIREGRYGVLRSAAADLVSLGQRPVLVAPFTRELTAGPEWDELTRGLAPAQTLVVYVDGSPELLASRRAQRQASRDLHRPIDVPVPRPKVPHVRVDASLSTDTQVECVLSQLR